MFEYRAKIVSVYDGDTCRADIDCGFGVTLKNQQLRIHGVDTPEIGTDAGFATGLCYLCTTACVGALAFL